MKEFKEWKDWEKKADSKDEEFKFSFGEDAVSEHATGWGLRKEENDIMFYLLLLGFLLELFVLSSLLYVSY